MFAVSKGNNLTTHVLTFTFDGQPIILIYPKPLQKTTDGTSEIMPSNK
jgi:hypothetical protein